MKCQSLCFIAAICGLLVTVASFPSDLIPASQTEELSSAKSVEEQSRFPETPYECAPHYAEKERDFVRAIDIQSSSVTISPNVGLVTDPPPPTITLTDEQVRQLRLILEKVDTYSPCPGGIGGACGDYGISVSHNSVRSYLMFCAQSMNIIITTDDQIGYKCANLTADGVKRLNEFFDTVMKQIP